MTVSTAKTAAGTQFVLAKPRPAGSPVGSWAVEQDSGAMIRLWAAFRGLAARVGDLPQLQQKQFALALG